MIVKVHAMLGRIPYHRLPKRKEEKCEGNQFTLPFSHNLPTYLRYFDCMIDIDIADFAVLL